MKSYLYIGGGKDGLNLSTPDILGALSGVLDNDLYIRDTLTIGDASITIYRHESLTSEQVLDRFVDSYHVLITLRALTLKLNPEPDVELGQEIDTEEVLAYDGRLWNLETFRSKGRRYARRYIRFVGKEVQRRSRISLGPVTDEIDAELKQRRGSGRHKQSRAEADALGLLALAIAESVVRDKEHKRGGREGKNLSKR